MEAYFNELSCFPLCTSRNEAKERANELASLLAGAANNGFKTVRCIDKGISGISLQEDYTLADLCNRNPRGIREMLLLTMLRPPYFAPDSEEEKTYIENAYQMMVPDENGDNECKDVYGMAAACIYKSIGLNFCSSPFWKNQKEYQVIERKSTNTNGEETTHNVLAFSEPEDFNSEPFMQWQVENLPRNFRPSTVKEKHCNLSSDHHGNNRLREFAEKSLFRLPFIEEVVTSIAYSPHCKTFVKALQIESGRIEVVMKWTEEGFGMVLQTTARNEVELRQMADELEKLFGNR